MKNEYYSNSKDYINRWVVSYADFVTMLLALFMVMYAVSMNGSKEIQKTLKNTFNTSSQIELKTEKISTEKVHPQEPTDNKPQDEIFKANNGNAIFEILKTKFANDTSLSVVKEDRGTIIRINDSMLFDEGSAIIKSEAKYTLEKIISELRELDNPIIIEGHTDNKPISTVKYPSNWELSTARATNIIKFLTENNLITPKRLSAVGYGEYMPIADNSTTTGRAKNRRVDIIVLSKN